MYGSHQSDRDKGYNSRKINYTKSDYTSALLRAPLLEDPGTPIINKDNLTIFSAKNMAFVNKAQMKLVYSWFL